MSYILLQYYKKGETTYCFMFVFASFKLVACKNGTTEILPFFSVNPCELHCRPLNEYFSDKMADAVIDGTRCYESSQSRDMCINGICKVSRTFDIPLIISFKKCRNIILWKLFLCNRGLQAEQEIVILKEIYSCLTKAQHAIFPQNCLLWSQHTPVSREVRLLWTEALVWVQHCDCMFFYRVLGNKCNFQVTYLGSVCMHKGTVSFRHCLPWIPFPYTGT